MGETPEQSNEGQYQGDRSQPQDRVGAGDTAKAAWNKRAEQAGRSGDKASRAYTGPDPKGDLYDMATPPPRIGNGQAKTIPSGDLGDLIPKREPPASATKLRHPSAPPGKEGASTQKDKIDTAFRSEVGKHGDAVFSQAEKAERARVAQPQEGVGFGFGKDKPSQTEVKRWYNGLSAEDKAALKDTNTTVHITATCSKPGKPDYNQNLSDRRAESMAKILQQEYGVDPSRIKAVGLGEDAAQDNNPDAPDNQDDHQERVALIHFEKKSSAPVKEAAEAGQKAGDSGKPPEPSEKYKIEDGIKDSIINVLIKLRSESVKAAKTVVDYATHFFLGVGEAHAKNEQASTARGVQYSLSIMNSDVTSNNPHVTEGKPYSAGELSKRIRENGPLNNEIQREMPYLKVLNSEADKQFRKGMDVVARNINPVLAKASTPEQRRAVIKAFVNEGTKRIQQAYRTR